VFQTFNGLKYKIDFQNSKYHDDFSILLRIYPGGVIEATGKTLPAPPAERTSISDGNFERPIAIYISVYTLVHSS